MLTRSLLALSAASIFACKSPSGGSALRESVAPAEAPAPTGSFEAYVKSYKGPEIQETNAYAHRARLDLIDAAPEGATIKLMTFLWDPDPSSALVAAHLCAAALRGVRVQLMPDAKSGSIADDSHHFFNYPVQEETYKYLANCGVRVIVYNHIGPTYFTVYGDKIVPSKKLIATIKNDLPSSPINRINHRKLLIVESGDGEGKQGCMIGGGRNIGDHYFGIRKNMLDYHDSDVLICRHHLADHGDELFALGHKSIDELWNQPNDVYTVVPDKKFRFKHIWFAPSATGSRVDDAVIDNTLDSSNPVAKIGLNNIGRITKGDPLAKQLGVDPDELRKQVIPPADAIDGPREAGTPLEGTYDWTLLFAGWRGERDEIREALLAGIAREQEEVFIESGYVVIDKELGAAIKAALQRGVKVTVITNSFPVLHHGGKPIRLLNDSFISDTIKTHGGPGGLFSVLISPGPADRVVHAKEFAFSCQRDDSGGTPTVYAYASLGSHNFHPRSGVSDKEIAFAWRTRAKDSCLQKVPGAQRDPNAPQDLADGRSIIEIRREYYKNVTAKTGIPQLINWLPYGGYGNKGGVVDALKAKAYEYIIWGLEPARDIIEPYL